jgi:hypothetical protein
MVSEMYKTFLHNHHKHKNSVSDWQSSEKCVRLGIVIVNSGRSIPNVPDTCIDLLEIVLQVQTTDHNDQPRLSVKTE